MKKSAFACLAVLTMSLAVSAASADDYVTLAELGRQAADGWHQTYQAKSPAACMAPTVWVPTRMLTLAASATSPASSSPLANSRTSSPLSN